MRSRSRRHCASRLFACLLFLTSALAWPAVALAGAAAGQEAAPLQQRLDRIEQQLRRLPAGNAEAASRVARELASLRREIEGFLESYEPARAEDTRWLEPAAGGQQVEDLAAELGRLRAAVLRIAASQQEGSQGGAFYLGRVDVAVSAARRVSATTEMAPAGAAVIESKTLAAHDRSSLSSALQLASGVSFVRVGQRNETSVYVRGFDMRQVPLFIDGIPVYTPYDGYADLERFTTYDVAELRVSKGFASVLYGANVLGGAINIISRRPSGRLDGTMGASAGSGGMRSVHANVGTRLGRWYLQGSGSYLDSDTFPLPGGFASVATQPAGDRLNAERRDGKVSAKLGFAPEGGGEYAVSYVAQRGRKGNPPYAGTDTQVRARYWRWPYWDKDSVYFVSNTPLGSLGYLRGRAYADSYGNALWSYDDARFTTQARSSSFRSVYDDQTLGASLEWGTTAGSRHTLRAAAHVKHDAHKDRNEGEPDKEYAGRLYSVGVEDSITLSSRLSLVAGVGIDRQTTTLARDYQKGQTLDLERGSTGGVNPQAGAFFGLPSGMLRATVSRKSRLPSMKDRYSYKFGTAIPNPDLRPERVVTAEAGYQGALGGRVAFQASVFYSRIEDLVQRFFLEPNLSQQRNIGRASHAGLELDARTRVRDRLDLTLTYTLLDRENLSDPETPLLDAPRHKGLATGMLTITPFLHAMASVEFESGRKAQNDAGRFLDVPSSAVASVKGVWTLRQRLDVEVGVMNLSDANYWLIDGFPEAGRTVQSNVRYRF